MTKQQIHNKLSKIGKLEYYELNDNFHVRLTYNAVQPDDTKCLHGTSNNYYNAIRNLRRLLISRIADGDILYYHSNAPKLITSI